MGMFDTLHLKQPLVCPVCGGGQLSHQTHAFADVMADFTGLWRLPEEILSAPDPLAAIIEKNTPDREETPQDDDIC